MAAYLFSFLTPFLLAFCALELLTSASGKSARDPRALILLGIISALAVNAPVHGIPLARWLGGVNLNFSIPLMSLLIGRIWGKAVGKPLLDRKSLDTAWFFGVAAATALYPMALGFGMFDPYALGWEWSPLFACLFAVTVALLLTGNRFGVVLAASMAAFDLHLLESTNLWDYLVDPVFAVAALVGMAGAVLRRRRRFSG